MGTLGMGEQIAKHAKVDDVASMELIIDVEMTMKKYR